MSRFLFQSLMHQQVNKTTDRLRDLNYARFEAAYVEHISDETLRSIGLSDEDIGDIKLKRAIRKLEASE